MNESYVNYNTQLDIISDFKTELDIKNQEIKAISDTCNKQFEQLKEQQILNQSLSSVKDENELMKAKIDVLNANIKDLE